MVVLAPVATIVALVVMADAKEVVVVPVQLDVQIPVKELVKVVVREVVVVLAQWDVQIPVQALVPQDVRDGATNNV
jgi:hypothetical protein